MKNTLLILDESKTSFEQQKKQVMLKIKELQRDMIKASFQQASGNPQYAELLQAINTERKKLKSLNQQMVQLTKT